MVLWTSVVSLVMSYFLLVILFIWILSLFSLAILGKSLTILFIFWMIQLFISLIFSVDFLFSFHFCSDFYYFLSSAYFGLSLFFFYLKYRVIFFGGVGWVLYLNVGMFAMNFSLRIVFADSIGSGMLCWHFCFSQNFISPLYFDLLIVYKNIV